MFFKEKMLNKDFLKFVFIFNWIFKFVFDLFVMLFGFMFVCGWFILSNIVGKLVFCSFLIKFVVFMWFVLLILICWFFFVYLCNEMIYLWFFVIFRVWGLLKCVFVRCSIEFFDDFKFLNKYNEYFLLSFFVILFVLFLIFFLWMVKIRRGLLVFFVIML